MFRLDGKVALITGAGQGIGAAIAIALAKAGASAVVVNDIRDTASCQQTLQQVQAAGAKPLLVLADVRDEQQVEAMFSALDNAFGRLDILVNNAGIVFREDIFETSLEHWRAVIETHLTGTFLCSRAAARRMRRQRSGRIIQISSVVGQRGALKGFIHYATAKAGQLGFTKTLALTLAPYGITVNAVAPSAIDTAMLAGAHSREAIEQLASNIPLGIGSVQDVASAVVFLASDEAKHITAATLDVNGGSYPR